jgi:VanZ family protein
MKIAMIIFWVFAAIGCFVWFVAAALFGLSDRPGDAKWAFVAAIFSIVNAAALFEE